MPKFPKGSQEAKDYMSKLRNMRGKGVNSFRAPDTRIAGGSLARSTLMRTTGGSVRPDSPTLMSSSDEEGSGLSHRPSIIAYGVHHHHYHMDGGSFNIGNAFKNLVIR